MEQSGVIVFDKRMTSIIKGVAILFMMLLHCYSDNYLVELDFSRSLNGIQGVFKICVGMFVFMVGYGYYFSRTKDFYYSIQHIKKLLIPFWLVLFIFTFPICYKEIVRNGITTFLLNLIGVDSSYNWYSWFVYFFIYCMIVMPFISRFISNKPLRNSLTVIILSLILSVFIHEIPRIASFVFNKEFPPIVENRPMMAIYYCFQLTGGVVLGYFFAQKKLFERIRIDSLNRPVTFILCSIIIFTTLALRYYTYSPHNPFDVDIVYAPLMIGAIVVLFNKFRWTIVRAVLSKLGEVSVYMWFFHAVFFTKSVSWFYQPFITIFKNINLVVIWTILITFLVSWILKTVVDRITNRLKMSYGR